jgi:hypothetical protein
MMENKIYQIKKKSFISICHFYNFFFNRRFVFFLGNFSRHRIKIHLAFVRYPGNYSNDYINNTYPILFPE